MLTEGGVLLVRADADAQIGMGHVMRCLALAQAWQRAGGRAVFFTASRASAWESRVRSEGMELLYLSAQPGSPEDARHTALLAQKVDAGWVVVDGYHFGADYQCALRTSGQAVLFVDDNGHAAHYSADVVLNQNIHADEGLYSNRESYTRLLLGPRYALLRQEFLSWRGWERSTPDRVRNLLVTLGGSDPRNVTAEVIRVLQRVDAEGLDVVVVVGEENPFWGELRQVAAESTRAVRLVSNVTEMPELMAWADLTISAGGSTCWELAFMGCPAILLIVAENQRVAANLLAEVGVAVSLGDAWQIDPERVVPSICDLLNDSEARAQMSRKGRSLVDGLGASRVVQVLESAQVCR